MKDAFIRNNITEEERKCALNLKGVLIDFGFTLAYLNEGSVRRYREGLVSILMRNGYSGTLDEFTHFLESTYRGTMKGEVKDVYGLWKLLLRNLGLTETPELIRELTQFRKHHVATRFILYENSTLVLSVLKNRYKVALVSNCFVGLSDFLKALKLTPFFDCIILSYEVGVTKPHSCIYLEALQRLQLGPEECVFISDSMTDLEGAREVGLKTILIKQGDYTIHKAKDRDFRPDFQCQNISGIIEYLQ